MKKSWILLSGILGLFGGVLGIDLDHLALFDRYYFHWIGSAMFLFCLGLGFFIFTQEERE